MSEVNVELYEALKENECHLEKNYKTGEFEVWAIILDFNIREFCEAVGQYYFDEGGADCKLLIGGNIGIKINDIIIEEEEHKLSSYAKCFPDEWDEYKDEILAMENDD
ncbi:hypothetical protein D7D81_17110 [Halocella sp. SP3-1]|nr:hypothetical protein D7D81_17110 [Halocella sp. SP3-1]